MNFDIFPGYYAYIEGSPPRKANDQARLLSETVAAERGPKCMSFYYMMNGQNIGYLAVITIATGKKNWMTLWRKNGHQGTKWMNAAINIPNHKKSFQVRYASLKWFCLHPHGHLCAT